MTSTLPTHPQSIFNYPIVASTGNHPASNDNVDDPAHGDFQLQMNDEQTLYLQTRLRVEIRDLEWMARLSTYHATLCAYLSILMIPIAYCSDLPLASPIMTTPFGALSITAIIFNSCAAILSYMIIHRARRIPAEFPLQRTYRTPEPSYILHYIHYVHDRSRKHFTLTFFLGTSCVLFQIFFYYRLCRYKELSELRAQIAYYTSLLDIAPIRNHKTTKITSLTWGLLPSTVVAALPLRATI